MNGWAHATCNACSPPQPPLPVPTRQHACATSRGARGAAQHGAATTPSGRKRTSDKVPDVVHGGGLRICGASRQIQEVPVGLGVAGVVFMRVWWGCGRVRGAGASWVGGGGGGAGGGRAGGGGAGGGRGAAYTNGLLLLVLLQAGEAVVSATAECMCGSVHVSATKPAGCWCACLPRMCARLDCPSRARPLLCILCCGVRCCACLRCAAVTHS